MGHTGVAVLAAAGIRAAATAANEQAREQCARPVGGVQRLRYRVAARRDLLGIGFRKGGLPLLHGLPEVIIDDAEFWYIDLDPFGLGIDAQHPPAGVRVLHPPLAVPDHPADVKLVVEDAGSEPPIPPQGRLDPQPAVRAWDAALVQCADDAGRAQTGGIVAEDAADDLGLFGNDFSLAADRLAASVESLGDAIAVAVAAAVFALLHPSADAAMGLGGEVFEKQRVHRSLKADVKLADVTFGQGHDCHAGKPQTLEHRRHVLLIARDAIEGLRKHYVEPAALGVGHERLNADAEERGTRHRAVGVGLDDRPILPLRIVSA